MFQGSSTHGTNTWMLSTHRNRPSFCIFPSKRLSSMRWYHYFMNCSKLLSSELCFSPKCTKGRFVAGLCPEPLKQRLKPGHTMHAACMQAARLHAGCIRSSTPCILRRWRRAADRKSTPWMNTSILVVFLRSYVFIFSHDVIWHAHSAQHSSAVGVPSSAKNDHHGELAELPSSRCYVIHFTEKVRSHFILWENRDDT